MTLGARILDRLVLKPTRGFVDPENRQRRWIPGPRGDLEAWVLRQSGRDAAHGILAVKFPGAGGRAERGGLHPFDLWPTIDAEIWTINMPGYGGSVGRASLSAIVPAAAAVAQAAQTARGERPWVVIGNSIGCSAALYVAARFPVAGVILRNPVPLRELLCAKHAWWNRGWLTQWLIRDLPSDLDPIANAKQCQSPALFIQSGRDSLVPLSVQSSVVDNYLGPKETFIVSSIDHHEMIPDEDRTAYHAKLEWWLRQLDGNRPLTPR